MMKLKTILQKSTVSVRDDAGQRGTALVLAVFVLILVSLFVAVAMRRTVAEAIAVGNETTEGRTFYAAQASLEMMTRNFNKTFEIKLNPTDTDLNAVRNGTVPGHTQYTFFQELDRTSNSSAVVLSGGPYAGLYALRDNWRLRTTATDPGGVQVQLTRNILNNRIPIFQFGIFYDDDLELYRPPRFSFGGRVHSNRNFFISPGPDGIFFDSRVTAVGHIITDTWRNGYTGDTAWFNGTYIKNASGSWKQLVPTKGSVWNTSAGASNNIFASNPDMPPSRINPNWLTDSAIFDGNLQSGVSKLRLPLDFGDTKDLVEMLRRPKQIGDLHLNQSGTVTAVTNDDVDSPVLMAERFANKPGIRITLSDSKAKLPGCATGTGGAVSGACGIRLDGDAVGAGADPVASAGTCPNNGNGNGNAYGKKMNLNCVRGYQPLAMTDGYVSTRVNGERLFHAGRQVWIKVETVDKDSVTGNVITRDITADILSLGVTEQAPRITDGSSTAFEIFGYNHTPTTGTDSRSIIKLQRFVIPGPAIPTSPGQPYLSSFTTSGGTSFNVVVRYTNANPAKINGGCQTTGLPCTPEDLDPTSDPGSYDEANAHLKLATVAGNNDRAIVPFPIKMFDTREGTYYDAASSYTAGRVTRNGVMSLVDIDIANLRRFFNGDFNGRFPVTTPFAVSKGSGLRNTDIPSNSGWVLYVSDRRGDYDFDGEYDMEDIYSASPGNDGILQTGEDVNRNGILDVNYTNEAPRYSENWYPDYAAVKDHRYYRRGVRVINGTVLPGNYDSANASNTRGFTVATENGIYVKGNYNATSVANIYPAANTPSYEYLPYNTSSHVPASIVSDSITILSNNWNDAKSFAYPFDLTQRKAADTTIRFAIISGDTIATKEATPHQGGISPRLNGGVHNFKRFLERWTDPYDPNFKVYLNYSGSIINLFNSRNNNGSFKCCNTVYNPPIRNWVFDNTFLDPNRLPPGTPFFQYIQTTGFERTNS